MPRADEPSVPLERRVPDEPRASPSELPPTELPEQWYLPGYAETARLLGWRWVFLTPPLALGFVVLMIPLHPWLMNVLMASWKLAIVAVAIPLGVLAQQARTVIRARTDPFCIHCGYGLTGLPDQHVCPECGRPYSFSLINEYRRDPHWFVERYRRRHDLPAAMTPFDAGPARRRKSRDGT